VSPDGYRSEGTPSLSEGPDARGEPFLLTFFGVPSVSGYLSPLLIDSFIQEGEGA
jgi:hypothetical protein